jgi:hypothetical protein
LLFFIESIATAQIMHQEPEVYFVIKLRSGGMENGKSVPLLVSVYNGPPEWVMWPWREAYHSLLSNADALCGAAPALPQKCDLMSDKLRFVQTATGSGHYMYRQVNIQQF